MLVGVYPFLYLVGEGLLWSPLGFSPIEGLRKLVCRIWIKRLWSAQPVNGLLVSFSSFIARHWPENGSTNLKTRFPAKFPGANGLIPAYIKYTSYCDITPCRSCKENFLIHWDTKLQWHWIVITFITKSSSRTLSGSFKSSASSRAATTSGSRSGRGPDKIKEVKKSCKDKLYHQLFQMEFNTM